jgi:hypothetical protein
MFTLYLLWRARQDRRELARAQQELRISRELCDDAYAEHVELRRTLLAQQARLDALERAPTLPQPTTQEVM